MTTHTFTHRHRQVTLYLRGRAWYVRQQRKGQVMVRSLETPLKQAAVTKAKLWLDTLDAGNIEAARALMARPGAGGLSTVGDIIAWAESAPMRCSEATRRSYINCLRLVLRQATDTTDPDTLSASVFSPATVRAYYRAATLRAGAAGQIEAGSIQRSANSIIRQGSCLLAARIQGDMRDAGLVVPDLIPWFTEIKTKRFDKCSKGVDEWRAPSQVVIDCTLASWRDARVTDANVFLAMWLALSCGLRKGEISQARWDWFDLDAGSIILSAEAHVKDKTGRILVRPLEPWFSEGWMTRPRVPAGLILTGDDTERTEGVFRRVGALMRDCGWATQKTTHALRALAGKWAVEARGIYGAQQFLRHASVLVTEKHYGYLVKK
jgi:integrase